MESSDVVVPGLASAQILEARRRTSGLTLLKSQRNTGAVKLTVHKTSRINIVVVAALVTTTSVTTHLMTAVTRRTTAVKAARTIVDAPEVLSNSVKTIATEAVTSQRSQTKRPVTNP